MKRNTIYAGINTLVRCWQSEGDTSSPQELMLDAIQHLRWRMETKGCDAYTAASMTARMFARFTPLHPRRHDYLGE